MTFIQKQGLDIIKRGLKNVNYAFFIPKITFFKPKLPDLRLFC